MFKVMTLEEFNSVELDDLLVFNRLNSIDVKLQVTGYSCSVGQNILICKRIEDNVLFYIFIEEHDFIEHIGAPTTDEMMIGEGTYEL
jgi:hypothetical protein